MKRDTAVRLGADHEVTPPSKYYSDHLRVYWSRRAVIPAPESGQEPYSQWSKDELVVGSSNNYSDDKRLNVALWTAHPALQTTEIAYMIMEFLMENPRDALHFAMALTLMSRVYVLLRRATNHGPAAVVGPGTVYKYVKIPTMSMAQLPMYGVWEEGFNTVLTAKPIYDGALAAVPPLTADDKDAGFVDDEQRNNDYETVLASDLRSSYVEVPLRPELHPTIEVLNGTQVRPTIFCYWTPSISQFQKEMVPDILSRFDCNSLYHALDTPFWSEKDAYKMKDGTFCFPMQQPSSYGVWTKEVNWMHALWMTPEETVLHNGLTDWESLYGRMRWERIQRRFLQTGGWYRNRNKDDRFFTHLNNESLRVPDGSEYLAHWNSRTDRERNLFVAALDTNTALGRCVECLRPLELRIAAATRLWRRYDNANAFYPSLDANARFELLVHGIADPRIDPERYTDAPEEVKTEVRLREKYLGHDHIYFAGGKDMLLCDMNALYTFKFPRVDWNPPYSSSVWNSTQEAINSMEHVNWHAVNARYNSYANTSYRSRRKVNVRKAKLRGEVDAIKLRAERESKKKGKEKGKDEEEQDDDVPEEGDLEGHPEVSIPLYFPRVFGDPVPADVKLWKHEDQSSVDEVKDARRVSFGSINPVLRSNRIKFRGWTGPFGTKSCPVTGEEKDFKRPEKGPGSRSLPKPVWQEREWYAMKDCEWLVDQEDGAFGTQVRMENEEGGAAVRCAACLNRWRPIVNVYDAWGMLAEESVAIPTVNMPCYVDGGLYQRMGNHANTSACYAAGKSNGNRNEYKDVRMDFKLRARSYDPFSVPNTVFNQMQEQRGVFTQDPHQPYHVLDDLNDPESLKRYKSMPFSFGEGYHDDARDRSRWVFHTTSRFLMHPKKYGPTNLLPVWDSQFLAPTRPSPSLREERTKCSRLFVSHPELYEHMLASNDEMVQLLGPMFGDSVWRAGGSGLPLLGENKFADCPYQGQLLQDKDSLISFKNLSHGRADWMRTENIESEPLADRNRSTTRAHIMDQDPTRAAFILRMLCYLPAKNFYLNRFALAEETGFIGPQRIYEYTEANSTSFSSGLVNQDPFKAGLVPFGSHLASSILREGPVQARTVGPSIIGKQNREFRPDFPSAFWGVGIDGTYEDHPQPKTAKRFDGLVYNGGFGSRQPCMLKEDVEWLCREMKRCFKSADPMIDNRSSWERAYDFQERCMRHFFGPVAIPSGDRQNQGTCYRNVMRRRIEFDEKKVAELLQLPDGGLTPFFLANRPYLLATVPCFTRVFNRPSHQQEEDLLEPSGSVTYSTLVNERYRTWRGCLGELSFHAGFPERKEWWHPHWYDLSCDPQSTYERILMGECSVVPAMDKKTYRSLEMNLNLWFDTPEQITTKWNAHTLAVDAARRDLKQKKEEAEKKGKSAEKPPSHLDLKIFSTGHAALQEELKNHKLGNKAKEAIAVIKYELEMSLSDRGTLPRTWKSIIKLVDFVTRQERLIPKPLSQFEPLQREHDSVWSYLKVEWKKAPWMTIKKDLESNYYANVPKSLGRLCTRWMLANTVARTV